MPVPMTTMVPEADPMMMMGSETALPMALAGGGMDFSSLLMMLGSMLMSGMGILMLALILLVPLLLLFEFLAHCRVFQKAGIPLWAPLIPIYNLFIPLKLIKKSYWYLLILLVPIIMSFFPIDAAWWGVVQIVIILCIFILSIIFIHCLSKVFGHGLGFTIGLIFLPFIFVPILAFGKSRYESKKEFVAPAPVVEDNMRPIGME